MVPAQRQVLGTVQLSPPIHHRPLAAWAAWSIAHGHDPRLLLRRLLLGDHVAAIRGRCHEFAVGGSYRWLRLVGETDATWPLGRSDCWAWPLRWRRVLDDCGPGERQHDGTVVVPGRY